LVCWGDQGKSVPHCRSLCGWCRGDIGRREFEFVKIFAYDSDKICKCRLRIKSCWGKGRG